MEKQGVDKAGWKLQHPTAALEEVAWSKELFSIREQFQGATVFLTGVTGCARRAQEW